MTGDRPLPLAGLEVLDLGRVYQGPWCGELFALAGANVVKVEEPAGEPARQGGGATGTTVPFAMLNSNKQAVTLNLKEARGRELFIDLVRTADVVLENFAPGTMDRLGIGPDALLGINPRLVYGAATAYGIDGPDRDLLGLDITIQAHTGVMSVTGFPDSPPVKAGVAFVDFLSGTNLYAGIVTALYERERTGRGRIVDVAMVDAIFPTLASSMSAYYRDGGAPRSGNGHGGGVVVPYDVYPTSDGHVAVIVITTPHWRRLCTAMGRDDLADDDRFRSNGRRYHNLDELDAIIADWTRTHTRDEVLARLREAKVPSSAVRTVGEMVEDRHLHERGAIQRMDHPYLGEIVVPHSALRFRGTPPIALVPSPALGADNDDIYRDRLGLSDAEIDRLRRQGVV
jgi:CoA:oxalate CoA-transferase